MANPDDIEPITLNGITYSAKHIADIYNALADALDEYGVDIEDSGSSYYIPLDRIEPITDPSIAAMIFDRANGRDGVQRTEDGNLRITVPAQTGKEALIEVLRNPSTAEKNEIAQVLTSISRMEHFCGAENIACLETLEPRIQSTLQRAADPNNDQSIVGNTPF